MPNALNKDQISIVKALPIADGCERVSLAKSDFAALPDKFNAERAVITQSKPWPFYVRNLARKDRNNSVSQFPSNFGFSGRDNTMLPSFDTFVKTGNPYLQNANTDANRAMKGYERNRIFTAVHHAMFDALKSGEPMSAYDVTDAIEKIVSPAIETIKRDFKVKSVTLTNARAKGNQYLYSVLHALQDLETCNSLVLPQDGKRNLNTPFVMQPALVEMFANNSDQTS